MGIASWFQGLRESRNGVSSPSKGHRRLASSSSINHRRNDSQRGRTTTSPITPEAEAALKRERRRSRRQSQSRRRSWFGIKPDAEEDVPEVPRLAQSHALRQQTRPYEMIELPSPPESRTRRQSKGRTLKYYDYEEDTSRQQSRSSWYSKERRAPLEALPPMPAIPVTVDQSSQRATATLPAQQRRMRSASINSVNRKSMDASSIRLKRHSRRHSSWWESSNPDYNSDDDIPPVPALVRDPESVESSSNESSDASDSSDRVRRQPRPLSTASRRSTYVPKSAAKGFLKSTNGASEETRKSFRKSFHMDEDATMVCLTDEQRIEWAKLMDQDVQGRSLPMLRQPKSSNNIDEVLSGKTRAQTREAVNKDERGNKFSNDQALAALEFGL